MKHYTAADIACQETFGLAQLTLVLPCIHFVNLLFGTLCLVLWCGDLVAMQNLAAAAVAYRYMCALEQSTFDRESIHAGMSLFLRYDQTVVCSCRDRLESGLINLVKLVMSMVTVHRLLKQFL